MSKQSADNTQSSLLCRLIYKSNTCWDDLSNELRMDYADFEEFEEAEWVLNSRIYDHSNINRWS